MLNERVFFWLDPARMNRQHRACSPRPQVVLTIDTARLVETHREQVSVSPINTGNARRRSHPPVEVTITGAIPAIGRYIADVTPLHARDQFSPA
jgi:hypothetical protein